jgi:hypothetical protein
MLTLRVALLLGVGIVNLHIGWQQKAGCPPHRRELKHATHRTLDQHSLSCKMIVATPSPSSGGVYAGLTP